MSAIQGFAMNTWNKVKLVTKVIEVRLRFIAILVATALLIGYWDTIENYWDKWTRPAAAVAGAVDVRPGVLLPDAPASGADQAWSRTAKCPSVRSAACRSRCGKKGEAPPLPQGVTGRVQLSPDRIQLAGIQTVEVAVSAA